MPSSLRIRSRVTAAVCRFEPSGRPLVVVELDELVAGLPVHAHRLYPDASNTSGHAARALAARLQGQQVEFDALSPRLSNRRLLCLADDFHILGVEAPGHDRKDLA